MKSMKDREFGPSIFLVLTIVRTRNKPIKTILENDLQFDKKKSFISGFHESMVSMVVVSKIYFSRCYVLVSGGDFNIASMGRKSFTVVDQSL